MSTNPQEMDPRHSLGGAIERLRSRWGWFVAYGAICLVFGIAALVLAAASTLAVVFFIALMLIVAGGVEIVIGFNSRDWPAFFLWMISGLFYLVFGAFALAQPVMAAAALTSCVGIGFLIAGIVRNLARLPASRQVRRPISSSPASSPRVRRASFSIGWPGDRLLDPRDAVWRRSGVLGRELDRAWA